MYEDMFNEYMDLIEFDLVKRKDGTFSVRDLQGGNLGNVEEDTFKDASGLLDRLDRYTDDYFVRDVEMAEKDLCFEKKTSVFNWHCISEYIDHLKTTELYKEFSEYCRKWEIDVLDMIYNHSNEINLNNCIYWEEE